MSECGYCISSSGWLSYEVDDHLYIHDGFKDIGSLTWPPVGLGTVT